MEKVLKSDFATVIYNPATKVITRIILNNDYSGADSIIDLNDVSGIEDANIMDCEFSTEKDVHSLKTLLTGGSCFPIKKLVLPRHITSVISIEGLEDWVTGIEPEEVVWPDHAPVIPASAFRSCRLSYISNIENVSTIEAAAFQDALFLCEFNVPKNLTVIPERCFWGCFNLENITGLKNIEHLGEMAFCGCKSLHSVKFSTRCSFIGANCFWGCSSLSSISGYNPSATIEKDALNTDPFRPASGL